MDLILSNRWNWWQVYSALMYLVVYQISNVCLELMYMQHTHMVYGELYRHHYLVSDKNASDNTYSAPLCHEVFNVECKMVMMGIDFCYNKLSYLCVQHQHYLKHDTVCLYIFFPFIVYCFFPDQKNHFCWCSFVRWCWNSWAKLTSYFWLPVCICIF